VTKEISLEAAMKINACADTHDVFEIHSKHIARIFVHEGAAARLKEQLDSLLRQGIGPTEIARQIGRRETKSLMQNIHDGYADKAEITSAKAIDKYFYEKFKTTIFDVETLFAETVQSESQRISRSPDTNTLTVRKRKRRSKSTQSSENPIKKAKFENAELTALNSNQENQPLSGPILIDALRIEKQVCDPLVDWSGFSIGGALTQFQPVFDFEATIDESSCSTETIIPGRIEDNPFFNQEELVINV
jgi:hypothetical protein